MKTIVLICLFVHILMSVRPALANSCAANDATSETAKSFAKYCKLNAMTFVARSNQSLSGVELKTKLENGPQAMTCDLKTNVYECRGKVDGYSEPVRIYFKSDMKKPSGLNIHFHGHYNDGEGTKAWNYPFSADNGNYAQMLSQSKSQSILIVPESKGAVATYRKDLSSANQWTDFLKSLERRLGTPNSLPLSLSGHSGADVVLNSIGTFCANQNWDCARVKAMGLFDSNYGKMQNGQLIGRDGLKTLAAQVADHNGNIYIRNAETGGLELANKALTSDIAADRVNSRTIKANHMAIMKDGGFSYFLEY